MSTALSEYRFSGLLHEGAKHVSERQGLVSWKAATTLLIVGIEDVLDS